ncbi:MAG TPA: hypothetical protein VGB37_10010 [Candidatus Lokiarchaeia archaeon]
MHKNISKIIVDCCKKEGLNYTSVYLKHPEVLDDVYKLRDVYLQLKEIAGTLQEISEKYNLKEFATLLKDDLDLIMKTDHDVLKIVQKLLKDEKC